MSLYPSHWHQYHSAPGLESQMAVWLQRLCLGFHCYVGYTGWGTANKVYERSFGCCLYVSSCRGLSRWRWWQPGNHRSETESSQTRRYTVQGRTYFAFVDPLSPNGDTEKRELLRLTQPNRICIFMQDVCKMTLFFLHFQCKKCIYLYHLIQYKETSCCIPLPS